MKKYRISPLTLMLMAAFIVIDGSWFALYAVLCALWHESFHIIALKILGGSTRSVTVSQYGIGLKTTQLSYRHEAAVALAGPLASFAAFVFLRRLHDFLFSAKRPYFLQSPTLPSLP